MGNRCGYPYCIELCWPTISHCSQRNCGILIGIVLALRILLPETILIPLGFMLTLLLRPSATTTVGRTALVSLAMYVGLVTNTDFNSFRQNIPFMAVMGVVILHAWMPNQRKPLDIPAAKTFAT